MLQKFRLFDPQNSSVNSLPDCEGNYFLVLRNDCNLPSIDVVPEYHQFIYGGTMYNVVYVGKTDKSLRKRDYNQHFESGTARSSTLRKSLGVLMGLKKEILDKGKYKFIDSDEDKLSCWMKKNLLLFYYPNSKSTDIEKRLITHFSPPLNIQGTTSCYSNVGYRSRLKELRNNK